MKAASPEAELAIPAAVGKLLREIMVKWDDVLAFCWMKRITESMR